MVCGISLLAPQAPTILDFNNDAKSDLFFPIGPLLLQGALGWIEVVVQGESPSVATCRGEDAACVEYVPAGLRPLAYRTAGVKLEAAEQNSKPVVRPTAPNGGRRISPCSP
jgi:hypothetical protein